MVSRIAAIVGLLWLASSHHNIGTKAGTKRGIYPLDGLWASARILSLSSRSNYVTSPFLPSGLHRATTDKVHRALHFSCMSSPRGLGNCHDFGLDLVHKGWKLISTGLTVNPVRLYAYIVRYALVPQHGNNKVTMFLLR